MGSPGGSRHYHTRPVARLMDHDYIDEHDIANRYVMRTLSNAQEAEYEAHFVACADCLAQLRDIQGLRAGLKQVAADDATGARRGARSFPALSWLSGWPRAALAAAVLLLIVGASYLAVALSTTRRELTESRRA